MTPQQKTFTSTQIANITGYSAQRLSQLREEDAPGEEKEKVPGKEGEDFYFYRGTYYFNERALMRILEYKKRAKLRKGGRPRKISTEQKNLLKS